MSREDARSARRLCDSLFERAETERFLTAAISTMAEKRKRDVTLREVTEALGSDEAGMSRQLEVLTERGVAEKRGDRLLFPSDYVFAELAARCGAGGPEGNRAQIFFWLITSDPTDARMSRAFGRFIVLAQNAVMLDEAWVAALDQAIALDAAYAVERAANLVGKLASAQAQAFEYIERLACGPVARKRWFVCLCLGHMTRRHDDAARLLVQLMKDHVWSVWWAASLSLGKMAVKSMAARWALQMLSKGSSEQLRERAARGLAVLGAGGRAESGLLKRLVSSEHRWMHDAERSQAKRESIAEDIMAEAVRRESLSPGTASWQPWGDLAERTWLKFEAAVAGGKPGYTLGDEFPDLKPAEPILRAAEAHPDEAIDWAARLLDQGPDAKRRGVAWLQRFAQLDPERTFAFVRDCVQPEGGIAISHMATLIEACLAALPRRAHVWLREIVARHPGHPVLEELGVAARLDTIARLAAVYRALGEEGQPDTALMHAEAVFAECRRYDLGDELYRLCHILCSLVRTSRLREVAERRADLEGLLDLDIPDLEEIQTALRKLHSLMDLIGKGLQAHEEAGEIQYLTEARRVAEQIEPEVTQSGPAPELRIIGHVIRLWIGLIKAECDAVRQRAELTMELKTQEVVFAESVTIALEVSNVGRNAAENVNIELLGSDNYTARRGVVQYSRLTPGETHVAEFEVEPLTREGFRVNFEITFDDGERAGKSAALAGVVTPVWQGGDLGELRNPYVPGTPLREGSPIFFGRDDLFDFLGHSLGGAHQENVLLLIGQRRTGKTSALKQLPGRLDESKVPVFVDCQGLLVRGTGDLLHRVASIVHMQLVQAGCDLSLPSRQEFQDNPDITFEHAFLGEVRKAIGGRLLVLVLDEFEELEEKVSGGALPAEVFAYLRHLMQHVRGLAFILAGTHKLEELSREYWSFLFNIALCKKVGFLSPEATRDLIVEPVKDHISFDDMAIDYIQRLTSGHPYFLQLSCWRVVQHCIEKGINNVVFRDVHEVTESIIERGEDNLSYLWDMAAPEERLLLVLLAKLVQDQGTVEAPDVVASAQGRSLKLSADDASGALSSLLVKDIITESQTDPPRYDFRMKLFQIWIERSKSVERVADSLQQR